jgi:hypothetical protein
VPHAEFASFMRDLRLERGLAARALELTILTATRTGESTGALWAEFELDEAMWTIPGTRMKAEEVAPRAAVPVGAQVAARTWSAVPSLFFPGMKDGKPLSNMAMLVLHSEAHGAPTTWTVHGFRFDVSGVVRLRCRTTRTSWPRWRWRTRSRTRQRLPIGAETCSQSGEDDGSWSMYCSQATARESDSDEGTEQIMNDIETHDRRRGRHFRAHGEEEEGRFEAEALASAPTLEEVIAEARCWDRRARR